MDHAVQWNYNIQTMQGRGSFPMLLWHYSFHRLSTKQMRAVRGVSTIISRGARSILQIQQYYVVQTTIEYVSLLKIAGWRSIYSEWRTLTTSQNSGISTYSVFGRCAERYVLQVLYLTSQYLCTVIGNIRGRQTMLWYFYSCCRLQFQKYHTQNRFFYVCCHGCMHTFFSLKIVL